MTLDEKIVEAVASVIAEMPGDPSSLEIARAAITAYQAEAWQGLRDTLERSRKSLQWMIDNDETNQGDEPMEDHGGQSWNEINAYWIAGLSEARESVSDLEKALAALPPAPKASP